MSRIGERTFLREKAMGSDPYCLQSMPNKFLVTKGLDGLARLTSTTLRQSGGTVPDRYAYAHNLTSQRTRMTRTDGSCVDYA